MDIINNSQLISSVEKQRFVISDVVVVCRIRNQPGRLSFTLNAIN